MAEGYLKLFAENKALVYSAGVDIKEINPNAIYAMAQDGIDISKQTVNHVDEYRHIPFDIVITVCDHANESCPIFANNAIHIHHNFHDPAKTTGSKETIEKDFAETRNAIKAFCKNLVEQYVQKT